ncbi:MAG: metallophosphoesterase [Bacteroidales bacterium]|nr:metallophosphoesterase [Bacteroidales bacterium]
MLRTFVIGDIHGANEALLQVFDRSGFDPGRDRLICLGDVCDRHAGVKACVEELLKIKDLVMILGNHDLWALEWMETTARNGKGFHIESIDTDAVYASWLYQGGDKTILSYSSGIPESHIDFFRNAKYYHIENNRLFVHGGIDRSLPLEKQDTETFLWDRSLVKYALKNHKKGIRITDFDEIFVGHTPTINFLSFPDASTVLNQSPVSPTTRRPDDPTTRHPDFPIRLCNVWLMDTGAGWAGGRLSMMEVETGEVWQSDRIE